jgi:hypothetical protein
MKKYAAIAAAVTPMASSAVDLRADASSAGGTSG